jgi:hypothetical protein
MERRVEEEQQDESGILIEKQLTIASAIAFRTDIMEAREQGLKLLEILQAANTLGRDWILRLTRHRAGIAQLSNWQLGPSELPMVDHAAAFMPKLKKTEQKAEKAFDASERVLCRTLLTDRPSYEP